MNIRSLSIVLGSFCYISMTLQTALADDTEIYVSRKLPEDQQVRPNLMFVIDNSGSMLSNVPGTTCAVADRSIRNRCKKLFIPQTRTRSAGRGRCHRWTKNNENKKPRLQVVKDVTNELVEE